MLHSGVREVLPSFRHGEPCRLCVCAVPFSDKGETTAKSEVEHEDLNKETSSCPGKIPPALDDHRRRRIISDAQTNKCCHLENLRERVKKLRMA
jgi:hypothetical protein